MSNKRGNGANNTTGLSGNRHNQKSEASVLSELNKLLGNTSSSMAHMKALEPRILLDAAMADTADAVIDQTDATPAIEVLQSAASAQESAAVEVSKLLPAVDPHPEMSGIQPEPGPVFDGTIDGIDPHPEMFGIQPQPAETDAASSNEIQVQLIEAANAALADTVAKLTEAEKAFTSFAAGEQESEIEPVAAASDSQPKSEIVFIDAAVKDQSSLIEAIGPNVEIVILDGDSDGVNQIAEFLEGRSEVGALHIISHGHSGTLDLGSAKLTEASMKGKHADAMAVIQNALSDEADILIYGCDFGVNARGASAVQALADLTGADVAASEDLTGAADLGGDWDLEVESGEIEATAIEALAYESLLRAEIVDQWTRVDDTEATGVLENGIGVTVDIIPTGTTAASVFRIVRDTDALSGDDNFSSDELQNATAIEIFINGTTSDTATFTLTFDQDVINPSLHFDYFGGSVSNGETNSPVLTLSGATNSGGSTTASLLQLAGNDRFQVSPTSVQATVPDFNPAGTPPPNAGGSVQVNGTVNSITFDVTGVVSPGAVLDGIFDSIAFTVSTSPDADGDGIIDSRDVDSDNDGIFDSVENPEIPLDFSGGLNFTGQTIDFLGRSVSVDGTLVRGPVGDGNVDGDIRLGDALNNNPLDALNTGAEYRLDFDAPVHVHLGGVETGAGAFNTGSAVSPGDELFLRAEGGFDVDDPNGELVIEYVDVDTIRVTATGFQSNATTETWSIVSREAVSSFTSFADGDPAVPFNIKLSGADTDGDGILNDRDLDSDNDGISDLVESGQDASVVDTNSDGVHDGAINLAGTPLQGAPVAAGAGATPVNTDNTGLADYLDLDSDDDGIADSIEARLTAAGNVITSTADADEDGVLDHFDTNSDFGGTFTAPVNTDGDGRADYVDADSDNDGISDAVESGASGTLPADVTFADADGTLDPATLPNVDSDASDVDFRTQNDQDGDGVADVDDIDDDNDGILDIEENPVVNTVNNPQLLLDGTTLTDWTAPPATNQNNANSLYIAGGNIAFFSDGIQQSISQTVSGFANGPASSGSAQIAMTLQPADGTGGPAVPASIAVTIDGIVYATIATPGGAAGAVTVTYSNGATGNLAALTLGVMDTLIIDLPSGIADTGLLSFDFDSTGSNDDFILESAEIRTFGAVGGTDLDRDGDGIANSLDLDSDNDGITDNIEAQATDGYIAPSGTVNAQGLDTAYAGANGLTPVNTDAAGTAGVTYTDDTTPDYLDTDSDGDGIDDAAENGLGQALIANGTLSDATNDTDGDGLFDVFETAIDGNADDGYIVNEGVTDPLTAQANQNGYLSDGGDAVAGAITPLTADLDFRDATVDNLPPIAIDDSIVVIPGGPAVNLPVLDNDSDPNAGDTISIVEIIDPADPANPITPVAGTVITLASGIQITPLANGTIDVLAPAGVGSDARFDYVIADQTGLRAVASATVRTFLDTDGDGIANANDLDSDNDGIADVDETFIEPVAMSLVTITPDPGTGTNLAVYEGTLSNGETVTLTVTAPDNLSTLDEGGGIEENGTAIKANSTIDFVDIQSSNRESVAVFEFSHQVSQISFEGIGLLRNGSLAGSVGSRVHDAIALDVPATWNIVTPGTQGGLESVPLTTTFPYPSGLDPLIAKGAVSEVLHKANAATNASPTLNNDVDLNLTSPQDTFQLIYEDIGEDDLTVNDGDRENASFTFSLENFTVFAVVQQDTDGDGVADYLDLDSDNDGISDLEESGSAAGLALDANNDGTLSRDEAGATGANEAGDADGDGLLDVFDADDADTSASASQGTTPRQTDSDGIADFLDLDSDDDGIADTIEARPTAGFVANDGDVTNNDADGDGVIDIFDDNDGTTGAFGGSFTTPVDTDTLIGNNGDGIADYLDTDSDGDGLLDSAESGLTPGADLNGDGIGDATGASFANPDGLAVGQSPSDVLANEVGDITELAFRELDVPPLIDLNSAADPADTNLDFSVTYTEGDPLTPISTSSDANDRGDNDLQTLTIATGAISDGDNEIISIGGIEFPLNTTLVTPVTVTLTSGAQVDVSYNATTGLFQIVETPGDDGVIADADMDEIVASVSYRHASLIPTGGSRTFEFQLEDNAGNTSPVATATVTVQPVLSPPLINPDPNGDNSPGGSYLNSFTENGSPVPIIDVDAVIEDVDSSVIENATIILTNPFPGDSLQVSIPSTIAGISALPPVTLPDGSLQLELVSSTASLTDMVAAIRSVTYSNNTESPDAAQRQITITLTDDTGTTGGAVAVGVDVVPINDRPVIDLDRDNSTDTGDDYASTYTENDPGIPILDLGDNLIADLDDPNMQSATVTLLNAETEDAITLDAGYTAPAGLTVQITGTTVNITGDASIADYQAALEAIRYAATGENPTAGVRTFSVVVNDGQDDSNVANASISIVAVNDAPIPVDPADPSTPADAMPPQTGDDASALTPFDIKQYFNDFDNPNTGLVFALGADTPSWMSLDAAGNIVGTPPADASQNTNVSGNADGVYTITVTATDPAGLTGQTTVTYTITNPEPVAEDDQLALTENAAPISGNVITDNNGNGLDIDPDGDTLVVSEVGGDAANIGQPVAGSNGGLFVINMDGSYSFDGGTDFEDLAEGLTRDTTITYQISDGEGGFDDATVTVTVTGTDDDPAVVPGNEVADQIGVDAETGISIDVTGTFLDPDANDALTYTATGLPAGLSLDLNTGQITGTIDPSASQNGNTGTPTDGVYTVVVTASDGSGPTASDTFTFTITNPAPIATDDAVTTDEDTAAIFNAITDNNTNGVDSDPDGDTPLTVSQVEGDAALIGTPLPGSDGGTFTIQSDGSVSFTPDDDFQYLDDGETATTSVSYQVSDGEGGFDEATITVTVSGANDAPIPVDPTDPTGPADPNDYIPAQSGTDNQPLTAFDTSIYFTDADTNDTLAFSSPNLPTWMTLDPASGLITGTPPTDASTGGPNSDGEYPITIEVTDGDETFTTTLVYSIANLPPVAEDDSYTTDEDTVLGVPAATGIIDTNDTDGDGDTLTVTQLNGQPLTAGTPVTLPSGALLTLNGDGSFDYDPNGQFDGFDVGESGTDTFTYEVGDGDGLFADATVTITVSGVNDVPEVVDPTDPNSTDPNPIPDQSGDDSSAITPLDVTPYFTDVDGEPLTYLIDSATNPGWLTIDPVTGEITGTPPADASQNGPTVAGTYPVTIIARDPDGAEISTVVDFVISNPAPVAEDDAFTLPEDGVSTGSLFSDNGSGPDSDPDGDTFAVSEVDGDAANIGQPTDGSNGGLFTINPDGSYEFDPGLDFNDLGDGETRDTTITYQISDGEGGIDDATVTITVAGSNDGPIPVDPTQPPITGDPLVPVDPDDPREQPVDPLDYIPAQTGDDGAPMADLVLTPYFGDPDGSDDIILSVDPADLPPGLSFDPLTGTISGTPDANASQDGDPGTPGTYTIPVTATDPLGLTFTTNVTYTITNPAPTAEDDQLALTENAAPITGSVITDDNGNGPDIDPDGDALIVSQVGGDAANVGQPIAGSDGGLFTINMDGTYSFDDGADFEDLAGGETRDTTITYQISDGEGGFDDASVTVTVTGTNDAPVPVDPTDPAGPADPQDYLPAQTGDDASPVTALDLTPFFEDPDASDTLTLTVNPADLPPGLVFDGTQITGTLTADASQGGDPGTPGTYTIPVTAEDGNGGSFTTNLVYTITNPAPVVDTPVGAQSGEDGVAVTIPVDFSDPDGDTLSYSLDPSAPAWLSIDPATGEVTGTPPANASQNGPAGDGIYPITVIADDGQGGTVTDTFELTITNPAPTAEDDAIATPEDGLVTGSVFADNGSGPDNDPDGDIITVSEVNGDPAGVGQPVPADNGGTVTLNADGTYEFNPGVDFQDLDDGEARTTSITYQISDGEGGFDEATVTVTVQGTNDAPVVIDPNDPGGPNDPKTPADPDNVIPDQNASDGTPLTPLDASLYFVDVDDEPLTFGFDPNGPGVPTWLSIDPVSGVVSGTPPSDASIGGPDGDGVYPITLTATDPDGEVVTTTVDFRVANLPPVAADDTLTIDEDTPLAGDLFADNGSGPDTDTGPDTDPLVVSAVDGVPANVGVPVTGSAGGLFTINPDGTYSFDPGTDFQDLDDGEVRETTISYQVSDGQGGFDEAIVALTVTGANDRPVVVDPNDPGDPNDPNPADPGGVLNEVTGKDGQPIEPKVFSEFFVDVDDEPLTYSLAPGAPSWLSINPQTGVLSGTPPKDASIGGPASDGIYPVSVIATDNEGETAQLEFDVVIENPAPVVTATIEDQSQLAGKGFTLETVGNFEDIDGDDLTYSATGLPGGLSIDPVTGQISGTIDADAVLKSLDRRGTYEVTVTVDDGQGGTTSATFTFFVGELPFVEPPVDEPSLPGVESSLTENEQGLNDQMIIDGAVNGVMSLGPDIALGNERPITDAVNSVGKLGPGVELDPFGNVISDTVDWMDETDERLRGQFTHGLNTVGINDSQFAVPYAGGNDLVSGNDGEILLRTVVYSGRTYLELIDESGGFRHWHASMADGSVLPDWVRIVGDNLLVIQRPANADEGVRFLLTSQSHGSSAGREPVTVEITLDLTTGQLQVETISTSEEQAMQGFSSQLHALRDGPANLARALLKSS